MKVFRSQHFKHCTGSDSTRKNGHYLFLEMQHKFTLHLVPDHLEEFLVKHLMKPSAASLPFSNMTEKLSLQIIIYNVGGYRSPSHGYVQPCVESCATESIFTDFKLK